MAFAPNIRYSVVDVSSLSLLAPLIDLVLCKCYFNHITIFLGIIYIPPDRNASEIEQFFDLLSVILTGHRILLLGDFNVPGFASSATDPKSLLLRGFCELLDLRQFNVIKNYNDRLLDLIFTNDGQCLTVDRDLAPLTTEDPHHPSLEVVLDLGATNVASRFTSNHRSAKYNFRRANFPELYADIAAIDWSFLRGCVDVDTAVDDFYTAIYAALGRSVPREPNRASLYPCWFTPEIVKNIKLKYHYRRKYLRTGDLTYQTDFRRLRALVKRQMAVAYSDFLREAEGEIVSDPTKVWRFVRLKSGSSRIPTTMYDGDACFDGPDDIVEAFARLFSEAYAPQSVVSYDDNTSRLAFSQDGVTAEELLAIMRDLPNKMTAGADLIPSFLVHDVRHVLAEPPSFIINLAITSCVFPKVWKRARVVPVFKKGDVALVKNYRPVAILSNFS